MYNYILIYTEKETETLYCKMILSIKKSRHCILEASLLLKNIFAQVHNLTSSAVSAVLYKMIVSEFSGLAV